MGKWFKVPCKRCDETGKLCDVCDGNGFIEVFVDDCPECHNGIVECDCTGGVGKHAADDDCFACGGEGKHTCPCCKGTGYDVDDLEEHGINPEYL